MVGRLSGNPHAGGRLLEPARKSAEQTRADAAAAERVHAALNDAPNYYFRDVDVRVDSGVASLSGYVWTTPALYTAQKNCGCRPLASSECAKRCNSSARRQEEAVTAVATEAAAFHRSQPALERHSRCGLRQ